MTEITAYKLFKVRKDGSLGPLFINARQRIPLNTWLDAEDHKTNGFAHRPGWHASHKPEAPHLSNKGRQWFEVLLRDAVQHDRPANQGGRWFVAKQMKVIKAVDFK